MKSSTTKLIAFIVVVLAIIAGIVYGINKPSQSVVPVSQPPVVKATSGPDNYTPYNFFNGLYGKFFSQGGGHLSFTATSTQSARTLTQAEMAIISAVTVTATNSPALTITLPASSTLTTLIKSPGDWRDWIFYNAQTGAATTTTIAGGTGVTVTSASGTKAIPAGKTAIIRMFRRANTDVEALMLLMN